jgi:hypothetical protein
MTAIFKNAIKKQVGKNVDGSGVAVYQAPTGKASYLIQCDIACTEDSGVQVTVEVVDATGDTACLVKNAPVPTGSSLQVLDGQKVVLESGDSLLVKCETEGSTVDVIVSLVEDVNS